MKQLKLMIALVSLLVLPTFAGEKAEERHYSVLLLNVTDAQAYDAYRANVKHLFAQAGGVLERDLNLMPPMEANKNLGQYNRAVVISYPNAEKAAMVMENPEYQKNRPTLASAVSDMAAFSATGASALVADTSDQGLFLIKLSWFKEDINQRAMEKQVRKINGQLKPYGFSQELSLNHVATYGLENAPNHVMMAYMPSMEAQQKLRGNQELYSQIEAFNKKWLDDAAYLVGTEAKPAPKESPRTDGIAAKVTPAPLQIVRNVKVDMPSEKLFAMLADHENLPKALDMIHDVKVDNSRAETPNGVGCERVCTLKDGSVLKEKIVSWTPNSSYAYAISGENPMGLKNHVGVFHVEPTRDGQTSLTWSQYFEHPMADQISAQIGGLMDMLLAKITNGNPMAMN